MTNCHLFSSFESRNPKCNVKVPRPALPLDLGTIRRRRFSFRNRMIRGTSFHDPRLIISRVRRRLTVPNLDSRGCRCLDPVLAFMRESELGKSYQAPDLAIHVQLKCKLKKEETISDHRDTGHWLDERPGNKQKKKTSARKIRSLY